MSGLGVNMLNVKEIPKKKVVVDLNNQMHHAMTIQGKDLR
jgi:hypothetical protein